MVGTSLLVNLRAPFAGPGTEEESGLIYAPLLFFGAVGRVHERVSLGAGAYVYTGFGSNGVARVLYTTGSGPANGYRLAYGPSEQLQYIYTPPTPSASFTPVVTGISTSALRKMSAVGSVVIN